MAKARAEIDAMSQEEKQHEINRLSLKLDMGTNEINEIRLLNQAWNDCEGSEWITHKDLNEKAMTAFLTYMWEEGKDQFQVMFDHQNRSQFFAFMVGVGIDIGMHLADLKRVPDAE